MRFVDHVPDHEVTRLVYRHLPSWYAVGCYFDWRKHLEAKVRDEEFAKAKASWVGRALERSGAVLTDEGWVIPTGPHNPRVIDQPTNALTWREDVERQDRIAAEVDNARVDHERALLDEDLWLFSRQWEFAVNLSTQALATLHCVTGRSKEREAFMARWHGENCPH